MKTVGCSDKADIDVQELKNNSFLKNDGADPELSDCMLETASTSEEE